MLSNLGVFFLLWVNILAIFASAGYFIFDAHIPDYANLFDALNLTFETSLGVWNMNIYDDFYLGSNFGIAF